MLRAVGFGDRDFDKPIVGVANGHSNMNPRNAGIQPLVDRAMAALKDAGAMPQAFGFPTVTDFHRAGGVPQVLKILLDHGVLHGDCPTITGRTIADDPPPRFTRGAMGKYIRLVSSASKGAVTDV